jgi:acyl-CoA synthetase (AMP-forming)/AMP-acid ligase II
VGDKYLLSMPFYHLGSRLMALGHHLRGGTVVMKRKFDPLDVVQTIERERVTQIHLAPVMLQQVLDLPELERYDLSSLKSLQHAAAPISVTLVRRAVAKFGPILIDGFGQTEGGGTTLSRYHHKPDGTPTEVKRLASVGQPLIHAQLKIVDDDDIEVPVGTIGEICFKSPTVMSGYWNNAQATIEALRGGWLHTGDVGYVDDENFLFLVDRKKDMIISGGENVYSREVEEALMAHGSLVDVAVIGLPDERWGEVVVAVVIPMSDKRVTEAELIAHCRSRIAGYKTPKRIEFVAELPRVPSGKINKVALRESLRDSAG